MSFLDKFKDQFVDSDDEELEGEYEEEQMVDTAAPVAPRSAAVRPAMKAAKPYTMVVVSPTGFGDAEKIADHLKQSRPVVMNLEKTEEEVAQRIVDFVQGSMYALDGRIDRISDKIYLCAPNNMSVSQENFEPYAGAGVPQWDAPKAEF